MRRLLRISAVVSSLTLLGTYVYLQTTGQSLFELWQPAEAEAGAPQKPGQQRPLGQQRKDNHIDMSGSKSAALPIRLDTPTTPSGYSSGVGAESTSPYLMTISSKSVAMPVQVQAGVLGPSLPQGGTIGSNAPQPNSPQPATAGQASQPPRIMAGSKSIAMPVQIDSATPLAPRSYAPPNLPTPNAPYLQSVGIQTAPAQQYVPPRTNAPPRTTPNKRQAVNSQYPLFQGVPAAVPAPNGSNQQR
ncbi:MAG: hypothetical protein QM775_34825 [Pirellulales bacterium]